MSFGAVFALAIALFVAAPIAAHLLRRRRTDVREFPPAKLIPSTAPTARKRSMLEDRFLFAIRALSVLVLAILGASPFVSCSHLTIDRKSGASVALVMVIDDSLSMQMAAKGKPSKLDRALEGARQLVRDAREGDAIAIVSAGAPSRVVLALTTDLGTAKATIDSIAASDRATDLDGAMALGEGLLKAAPQIDRRIVLFTDRADGKSTAPAIDASPDVSLWEPLPDLSSKGEADCAVISAERVSERVTVRVVCTDGGSAAGRSVTIKKGKEAFKTATIDGPGSTTVTIELPKDVPDDVTAELSSGDALAADDRAPVSTAQPNAGIGVVADPAKNRLVTGGAPPVEQAFGALDLASSMRPLASIPEHEVDLKDLSGLILDDPPGMTPEQRSGILEWVEKGGVLLLTLGRGAAAAPLGAGFDGFVPGVVRFTDSPADSADTSKCAFFGVATPSLEGLRLSGRVTLDRPTDGTEIACAFSDGAPLLLRRDVERGAIFVLAIPFSVDESDFAVRPAFLSLLDRFAEEARSHGGTRRVEVGYDFTFGGAKKVEGVFRPSDGSPALSVSTTERNGIIHVTPSLIGRYDFENDGQREARVALAAEREIDLRPRAIADRAHDSTLGHNAPKVDISRYVAIALLALIAIELAARLVMRMRKQAEPVAEPTS